MEVWIWIAIAIFVLVISHRVTWAMGNASGDWEGYQNGLKAAKEQFISDAVFAGAIEWTVTPFGKPEWRWTTKRIDTTN